MVRTPVGSMWKDILFLAWRPVPWNPIIVQYLGISFLTLLKPHLKSPKLTLFIFNFLYPYTIINYKI